MYPLQIICLILDKKKAKAISNCGFSLAYIVDTKFIHNDIDSCGVKTRPCGKVKLMEGGSCGGRISHRRRRSWGVAPRSPGRLHHLPRDLLQQQPLCGTAPCFPAAVLKEMELRFGLCLARAL